MKLIDLIEIGVQEQASDLHLTANALPRFRVQGELCTLTTRIFTADELHNMLIATMTEKNKAQYLLRGDIDYAWQHNNNRLRMNVFLQQHGISAAIRFINSKNLSISDLALPPTITDFIHAKQGLVIFSGSTGAGKSTTLSAFVEAINYTKAAHIITLEDPIEYQYHPKKSLIQQREIKTNCTTFARGFQMALRQDPDVIVVGELRDAKTAKLTLQAAETGHLILTTLHAATAVQSIARLLQFFGSEEENMRQTLSHILLGVLTQKLWLKKSGGQVAIFDLLVNTAAITHLLRENKLAQMVSVMQTQIAAGMQTFAQHEDKLRMQGII